MGRIEKTVFISYRRTNLPWALFVYQNLTMHGFDVFFDYESIDSGNFENAILDNIRSRAHFVIILTPSALERCKNPDDWLRQEIETALDEKRNIVPLLIEGFDYGSPLVQESLTGKLAALSLINGLPVPNAYALEAMNRLRERYLNKALSDVALPMLNTKGEKITEIQKTAANEAPPVSEEQLSAQTWFERGYVFQVNKNLDEALRCYSKAIHLDPKLDIAHSNLGAVFSEMKRYDEAEDAYRKAIEINPYYAIAYFNLGILLNNLKRNSEAEFAYRKAIEINPGYAKAYFNLGVLLSEINRYDEAENVYRKAIEIDPDANTYNNLGNLLNNLSRYDEAETLLRKAIEQNPTLPYTYNNLGNTYKALKQYDEAKANYRKAIEIKPDYATAYSNLGVTLNDLKRYEEAESAYRKAIELNSDEANAYSNLGNLLQNLKRYEEAEAAYRKAIELKLDDATAYSNLGSLLDDLKRYNEAEVTFRKAIDLDPSNDQRYIRLINLLRFNNNSPKDALPLLIKRIELNPDNYDVHLAIASIDKQLGKEIAKENIDKVRQFMPEDDWYDRACLESVCDNFDLAFEYLVKAAKLEIFNPSWAWQDPDLQWIRDDPRFVQIVGERPSMNESHE